MDWITFEPSCEISMRWNQLKTGLYAISVRLLAEFDDTINSRNKLSIISKPELEGGINMSN